MTVTKTLGLTSIVVICLFMVTGLATYLLSPALRLSRTFMTNVFETTEKFKYTDC